jgi:hypothetical protein
VRSGPCGSDKPTARHGALVDRVHNGKNGVEQDDPRRGRRKDLYGACIRVRMLGLHMNATFVFRDFRFRQVCVYRRRSARVYVHMEKRRIEPREKKRSHCAPGRQSSHGAVLRITQSESQTHDMRMVGDEAGFRY